MKKKKSKTFPVQKLRRLFMSWLPSRKATFESACDFMMRRRRPKEYHSIVKESSHHSSARRGSWRARLGLAFHFHQYMRMWRSRFHAGGSPPALKESPLLLSLRSTRPAGNPARPWRMPCSDVKTAPKMAIWAVKINFCNLIGQRWAWPSDWRCQGPPIHS